MTLKTEPEGPVTFAIAASPNLVEEASLDVVGDVTRRATRGAAALAVRQLFVYGSNIGGSIVLARLLPADQFGYYAIVVFALNFLTIFGGTGFASNLIRLPHEPTLQEKRAVFTSQEVIVAVILLGVWLIAPRLGHWYHLDAHGSLFFRLMGISLGLTSLMVIPQVQMERELAFDRLAIIEVCQAVLFNLVVIILALRGVGYISFAVGLVVRTAVGATMALCMSPWRMGLQLRSISIREHLHFGIALQAGQLLSVARDSLTPVFVGLYLGAADVGYITWAGFVVGYSVLILIPLQRLYLPLFAKVQSNRAELARLLNRVIWATNAVSAPLTLMTLSLIQPIVSIVFGNKWMHAVPLVYMCSVANFFIPSLLAILAMLNAIGRSKFTLFFTTLSLIGVWGLGIPLIVRYGIWGFGMTIAANQLLTVWLYRVCRKTIGLNPWPAHWPSWPFAIVIGGFAMGLCRLHSPTNLFQLLLYAGLSLSVYSGLMWTTSSNRIRNFIQIVRPSRIVKMA